LKASVYAPQTYGMLLHQFISREDLSTAPKTVSIQGTKGTSFPNNHTK